MAKNKVGRGYWHKFKIPNVATSPSLNLSILN